MSDSQKLWKLQFLYKSLVSKYSEAQVEIGMLKLYDLCRKHRIKWEDKKYMPFDRAWITMKNANDKVIIANFLGIDLLNKLASSSQQQVQHKAP